MGNRLNGGQLCITRNPRSLKFPGVVECETISFSDHCGFKYTALFFYYLNDVERPTLTRNLHCITFCEFRRQCRPLCQSCPAIGMGDSVVWPPCCQFGWDVAGTRQGVWPHYTLRWDILLDWGKGEHFVVRINSSFDWQGWTPVVLAICSWSQVICLNKWLGFLNHGPLVFAFYQRPLRPKGRGRRMCPFIQKGNAV